MNSATTSPSDSVIDAMARKAADIAMVGAGDYLRSKGITSSKGLDLDALCTALRAQVRADLPRAMDDAKEAFGAHMGALASVTFAASLRLSGIKAAKLFLGEVA